MTTPKSPQSLMQAAHGEQPLRAIPPIVLVVDDHADTVEMYEALLSARGFWVARASEALEAFEYAQDLRPDAIITDLGLPGDMDGADLIREIRADRALQDVPIVAVTGRDPMDVPSLHGIQISALLLKPVAPDTLLSRLDDALATSAALRARSAAALARVPALLHKSAALLSQSKPRQKPDRKHRLCPKCGQRLAWTETSRLQRVVYDYYRWCAEGCGLYCFNRETGSFELLAEGRGTPR
jgi:CheY-like chemotaxis protein